MLPLNPVGCNHPKIRHNYVPVVSVDNIDGRCQAEPTPVPGTNQSKPTKRGRIERNWKKSGSGSVVLPTNDLVEANTTVRSPQMFMLFIFLIKVYDQI